MRKNYLLIFCITVFSAMQLWAQTSDRISYQAVVRIGEKNMPVVNQACGVRISILRNSENNSAVYVEKHTTTTNANGLLTLAIGDGTVQNGSFASIDWANGPYFVKTEIDPAGGANYSLTSTTQLLTVPYALHAKSAATISGSIPAEKITGLPAGFSGDYNDLSNKPAFATVATTGSYNDLRDKPVIGQNGFSGNYADLSGKPSIKDSIATYGFNGNYDNLTNKPILFSGSYNDLTDVPTIQGFSGNYNDLSNKPGIIDSIAAYGFNGDYNNLTNKPVDISSFNNDANYVTRLELGAAVPEGNAAGDMLYWVTEEENTPAHWEKLSKGAAGSVLTVNAEGKPEWVNIAKLMIDVTDMPYDTIWATKGNNGKMTPLGKIKVARGGMAQFSITPNAGYGIDTVYIDNVTLDLSGVNRLETYSYLFDDIDATHYIHAVFGQRTVEFNINYDGITASEVKVLVNEDTEAGNAQIFNTAIGGSLSFSIVNAPRTGVTVTANGNDITQAMMDNNYTCTLDAILGNKTINITFTKNADTYAVGDIYPNAENPQGVVAKIKPGGKEGFIVNLKETEAVWSVDTVLTNANDEDDGQNNMDTITTNFVLSNYPAFQAVSNYGDGWYLPAINELLAISDNFTLINNTLNTISETAPLNYMSYYFSSTESEGERFAQVITMAAGQGTYLKTVTQKVRTIKKFKK